MKNIMNIFKTDMKNIGTNWVAAILIGGLIILPSLYAWLNIKASWDPYGQTDQIPVGVVNEDKGATVRDEEIHVGDELVDTLKNNDDMDWKFVDRDKAMKNVEYGDYFAVIVIPENFSENLGTVIEDNPKKAKIEYYVNEKINAIAPKITQKGASVLVDKISSEFISTVNGVIFDIFNKIGIEIEEDLPDIEKFQNYVFEVEEKLPEIKKLLDDSLSDANDAQGVIDKAQGLVPDAEGVTNDGLATIDETNKFLKEAENRLNKMAPQIQEDLEKVQNIASEANDFITKAQNAEIDFSLGDKLKNGMNEKINEATERIETVEQALNQLKEHNNKQIEVEIPQNEQGGKQEGEESQDGEENDQEEKETGGSPDGNSGPDQGSVNKEEINQQINDQLQQSQEKQNQKIDETLDKLATIKKDLNEIQENVGKVDDFLTDTKKEVDSMLADLQEITANTSNRIDNFVKEYKENIEPTVLNEISNAKSTLSDARNILVEVQELIPEVSKILSSTDDNLGEGKDSLESVLNEYPYVNDKVNELADRIRELQDETDINEIINLLKNDPEAERGFFAEPVELHENKLFPIDNYGTGMTPFYTVLSIWVGALLLISLLATDLKEPELYTGKQMYLGKFLTFFTVGLLQTLIVTLGDLFLIGVEVRAPVWFVIFGLLTSFVFMAIVYTVVSVFGDVGKAMAIVLLVLQIAGSGGTYPVVLLPEFFQAINPFLPFTYAVDLMREAVGGIVWSRATRDIIFLSLVGIGFILFGVFFKQPVNKHTNKLMKKSQETGLFH
ncbi:YhgE/Pip domain-containing protein [Virgibacillus alimentarius]|uniref:Membrane protein n=1 Tax=Virgibacillus alimentarius TaxID=698769 RepID=A0ABS4SFI3_9BACI|nr:MULTISPECIES: YhgE/Pip domain-containing protein [Virgibacillus]MBP2259117.1 putative membrane protein [Virgibacillus alimentarius]HLR65954.1 YhgE/Pip domain-containing protein [Virgibacillus sp.]